MAEHRPGILGSTEVMRRHSSGLDASAQRCGQVDAGALAIEVQVGGEARQTIGQQKSGTAFEDKVVAGARCDSWAMWRIRST